MLLLARLRWARDGLHRIAHPLPEALLLHFKWRQQLETRVRDRGLGQHLDRLAPPVEGLQQRVLSQLAAVDERFELRPCGADCEDRNVAATAAGAAATHRNLKVA